MTHVAAAARPVACLVGVVGVAGVRAGGWTAFGLACDSPMAPVRGYEPVLFGHTVQPCNSRYTLIVLVYIMHYNEALTGIH